MWLAIRLYKTLTTPLVFQGVQTQSTQLETDTPPAREWVSTWIHGHKWNAAQHGSEKRTTATHHMDENLKTIMLNKRSQTLKSAYCMLPLIWSSRKEKSKPWWQKSECWPPYGGWGVLDCEGVLANFLRWWRLSLSSFDWWLHGVCVSQNSSNCTPDICPFHYTENLPWVSIGKNKTKYRGKNTWH